MGFTWTELDHGKTHLALLGFSREPSPKPQFIKQNKQTNEKKETTLLDAQQTLFDI